ERTGRIHALELQPEFDAELTRERLGGDERRGPFAERHDAVARLERQPLPVAFGERRHVQPAPGTPREGVTGSTSGGDWVSGSLPISARAASTEPALVSWVTTCSVAPPSRWCCTSRAIETSCSASRSAMWASTPGRSATSTRK